MKNLETTFAGLELESPLIMGSCGLTATAQGCKKAQEGGAAAVVLKSLFEESITRCEEQLSRHDDHPEAADYLQSYLRSDTLARYLQLVDDSRRLCSIPVIASICCRAGGDWVHFARAVESAGADALQLNVMSLATDKEGDDGAYERSMVSMVRSVAGRVGVPVVVKLGSSLTNPVSVANRLKGAGAAAVVFFNRLYPADIDTGQMRLVAGERFSRPGDMGEALRWTAFASAAVKSLDFALSGGVHTGNDVVKALLAGASAVEVCSAVYRWGCGWFARAAQELLCWQRAHNFGAPGRYRGSLNASSVVGDAAADHWLRTQFMRYFGER